MSDFEIVIKINGLDQWYVLPKTITGRVFSPFERADVDSEVHLSYVPSLDNSASHLARCLEPPPPSSFLLRDITAEGRCCWHLLMN